MPLWTHVNVCVCSEDWLRGDPVKPGMAGREWGMGNGEWGMYMYLAMGCILVHSNTNVKEKVYNYSAYT